MKKIPMMVMMPVATLAMLAAALPLYPADTAAGQKYFQAPVQLAISSKATRESLMPSCRRI